jgi:hypothetical protein
LLESAASNRHHRSAHAKYQLTMVQIQALLNHVNRTRAGQSKKQKNRTKQERMCLIELPEPRRKEAKELLSHRIELRTFA